MVKTDSYRTECGRQAPSWVSILQTSPLVGRSCQARRDRGPGAKTFLLEEKVGAIFPAPGFL